MRRWTLTDTFGIQSPPHAALGDFRRQGAIAQQQGLKTVPRPNAALIAAAILVGFQRI